MDLAVSERTYHLKRRFAISSGARQTVDVVEVVVTDGDDRGVGESAPEHRVVGYGPDDAPDLLREWWDRHEPDDRPPAEAPYAGLDAALLDLEGRRRGVPVRELLGLDEATRPTSITVSLAEPDAMVAEAGDYVEAGFTHLKVKVGTGLGDEPRIAALRDAFPDATIRVDANGGWDLGEARELIPALADLDVELVEQPLPVGGDVAALPDDLPVYADESVVALDDLDDLAGYDGVVAKVDKHGGPRPTRDLLEAARERGVATMLGCNVASSLSIAAGAHLLELVDKADLDGALLLADDGYTGLGIEKGRIGTPTGPGLGVEEAGA